MRVCIPIIAVEKKPLLHFLSVYVCSLNHQYAKRMRRIYCHMWHVRLYHFLPNYLINGTVCQSDGRNYELILESLYLDILYSIS
jgi:hypothetical protein